MLLSLNFIRSRDLIFLTKRKFPSEIREISTGRPGMVTWKPAGRKNWLDGTNMLPSGWGPTFSSSMFCAWICEKANKRKATDKPLQKQCFVFILYSNEIIFEVQRIFRENTKIKLVTGNYSNRIKLPLGGRGYKRKED